MESLLNKTLQSVEGGILYESVVMHLLVFFICSCFIVSQKSVFVVQLISNKREFHSEKMSLGYINRKHFNFGGYRSRKYLEVKANLIAFFSPGYISF